MSAAPNTTNDRKMALLSEAVVPMAGILYSLVFIWSTWGLPRESTIFPRTILCALAILGVLVVLAEMRLNSDEAVPVDRRAYAMLGLSVVFVILMSFVGYLPAAVLFLLTALLFLKQKLILTIPVAIGLPGLIYVLFSGALGISL